jgi:ribonuclease-3
MSLTLSPLWVKLWEGKHPTQYKNLSFLQKSLDYSFKNPEFLYEALSHKSVLIQEFRHLPCNERLEFLGDSLLNLSVSTLLWHHMKGQGSEGELSKKRSSLVSEPALAGIARSVHLDECLLVIPSEKNRESLLADALEAVLGGIFLDRGFEAADRVVGILMKDRLDGALVTDYKTKLQEAVQSQGLPSPIYEDLSSQGPDHQRIFQVGVFVQGQLIAQGSGTSKKRASQDAAQKALMAYGFPQL